MRLWTIQTIEAWERCRSTGVLAADGRRVPFYYRDAYRWLRQQAKSRLADYSGRPFVWAWSHPKPDLRCVAHLPKGQQGVRIEFIVPADRILCSDFDAWHCVLNQGYLALSEEEDDAWDRSLKAHGLEWQWQFLPPVERREMEKSWERIFDLEALNASSWTGPVTHIQAVLERVFLQEVVRVDHFVAR
jgi:hypothetical protein